MYGVPSQCVLEKHIRKSNNDYMQNVALKINTKLGGVNWICAEPLPKFDEVRVRVKVRMRVRVGVKVRARVKVRVRASGCRPCSCACVDGDTTHNKSK